MPSPSPSRMNGYAGWSRVTGAIPWARASAQLTRPFRLSSPRGDSPRETDPVGATVVGTAPRANVINSVEPQPASTWSSASASRWSTVSPYRCRTAITRAANQQRFCAGSHSAQVAREPTPGRWVCSAQAAVVRLGPSHHVLRCPSPSCWCASWMAYVEVPRGR